MAKRRSLQPWPDTVWHTSGRVKNPLALQVIRQRLQQEPFQHWREYTPDHTEEQLWWWGFDAAWRTEDGDRIKARLELQPDPMVVKSLGLDKKSLETHQINIDMAWRLTAEADRAWCLDWQSPVAMFGDLCPHDYTSGNISLVDGYVDMADATPEQFRDMFREFSKASWYITVVTHDKRPIDSLDPDEEPALVHYLPPSLRGRVLEIRVFGTQDQIINAPAILPDSKLRLKRGGALIVPTNPRQEEWAWADYAVRRPSGGDMDQLLKETAEAVARYAALPPHYGSVARWCVQDLRETWVLPEIEVAPKRVLLEKKRTEEQVVTLQGLLQELRVELDGERREHQVTLRAKEQIEEQLRRLAATSGIQRIQELEEQAEVAWQAQEASDAHAEKLVAEVAYLRRLVSQIPGRTYDEPVPARTEGPHNWDELLQLAGDLLPKIRVLDSVTESLKKLRGHANEKTWLRKTWDTLEVYQAYAEAKETQGPEVLPHLQAYLQWELATALIPESWQASRESVLMRRDPKYAAMRTFTVPEHGPVLMREHVRVGGNRPPAPRMHLFDDTAGPTGLIWVGYIGPHLPNGSSRDD